MGNLIDELLTEMGIGLAYGGIGLLLLMFAYFVLDMVTPGKLNEQLMQRNSYNAALVLGSGWLAAGMIVATSLWTSEGKVAEALTKAFGFGLVGVLLLGVMFKLIDVLTPGKLGHVLLGEDDRNHPMAVVVSSALLAVGLVISAAIS